MEHTGNHITLCGTLRALPEYSHSNHERRFFRFELEVERLSGTADVLPVMAAEDVLMEADLFAGGRFLVEGQIRSFNSRAESGRRLIISVFAESVTTTEQPPQNDAVLTGTICKPPIYRRTPLGREICDVMLAVPRQPCLGLREFVCYFEESDGSRPPIDVSMDLGLMVYDVFDLHDEQVRKVTKPKISLYHAVMEHGVIRVPDYDSEDVLKGGTAAC